MRPTAINAQRRRGVCRVAAAAPQITDPASAVEALSGAFADFRERHDKKIKDVVNEIDKLNQARAAGRIGPGGVDSEAATGALREAQASLGEFVRSGKMGGGPNAAMTTESAPDGGYVVEPEVERQITRHQRDLSAMRRLARVVSTKSGDYSIPVAVEGVESGWAGEQQARPQTGGPKLALRNYPVHELYANPAVTQTLLDDAIEDIGAYLSDEIALAFDEKEGSAFINGDGVKKPRGFLTYDQSPDRDDVRDPGSLQFVKTGKADGFAGTAPADALIDLVYALRAPYRSGAVWLMNSKTASTIRKFKDSEGRYIWSVAEKPGQLPMLLGYPVEIDEEMPDVAADATPVAFGNFRRGYVVVDRKGIRLLRDALTNKPFVHFYTTKRVGGGVWQPNAIKLLKVAA